MTPRCNLIGIGAQKCATTWLHRVLEAHPRMGMSEPKELDFFSYYYDRGYEWYERHFPADMSLSWRGEISPSYFYNTDVPGRVMAYNDRAKVILILRDPVERAFSNHLHEVRAGNISAPDFESGLANNPAYLLQSHYGAHLQRWSRAVPAGQFKVVLQEDIKADPHAVLSDLCAWLGVDWSDEAEFAVGREANASADYKMKALGNITHNLAVGLRRSGLGAALEAVKKTPPVRAVLKANRQEIRDTIPPLSPETRRRLAVDLLPDMELVGEMLGRPELPWKSLALGRQAMKPAA